MSPQIHLMPVCQRFTLTYLKNLELAEAIYSVMLCTNKCFKYLLNETQSDKINYLILVYLKMSLRENNL